MSLLGNYAFGHNDRTENTSGIGSTVPRRPSYQAEDSGSPRPLHRHSTSQGRSLRRASVPSVDGGKPALADASEEEKQVPSSSSGDQEKNEIDDYDSEAERNEAVRGLARRFTSRSSVSAGEGENPFTADKDSRLDPNSSHFNARAWAKAMFNLSQRDPEHFKPRTAGFAFRNLNAWGYGAATDYQASVGNVWLGLLGTVRKAFNVGQRRIDILKNFDGLVESGEMLVVLGPPGSGCSTFLKTIAGETHGYVVDPKSYLNYQGISAADMQKHFRGEAIYTAEVEVHFPMLTVGDTLEFAACARAPRVPPGGVSRNEFAKHMRDVIMAIFGISHTINTKVGNDFVRGVSGGERKRVSIAEAALSGSPLQCWDNSTRGLDSANAVEFCKTLRMSTEIQQTTACVSIYQSPQSAYDVFDKVIVLYEGHQIFFGRTTEAKDYFVNMGFECPDRATTPDFLTSMTSPMERIVRPGFEDKVPRTSEEFAARWRDSPQRQRLLEAVDAYDKKYTIGGERLEEFKESRRLQQAKRQRVHSPYTLSYSQQVRLCLWRGFLRLKADPTLTLTAAFGNSIMALVIGSVFYNLQPNTNSFGSRGALLFFAILMNAFGSALEILTLYAQRPIVEKHARYALYHPSAEAFASMLTDMPYKIANAIAFNLVLYFMTNLRREPGAFFFFFFVSFILTLTMSMIFRTIASVSRTLAQALAPSAIFILAIVIYTGFVIPINYMHGWARWINYMDPIGYGFESLLVNEFHDRNFSCSIFVPSGPGYENVGALNHVCASTGSVPGQSWVSGDAYIGSSFRYHHSHKWRNVGIIFGFMIFFALTYLLATEYISAKKSKGEVLVFRRGRGPAAITKTTPDDAEAQTAGKVATTLQTTSSKVDHVAMIQKQTAIFHWEDVCYDIKIKSETRRILDHVDGWVKPGTLTALMGVSGAGKTTLLDVLATRVTMGVITGEMLVDGCQRDASFQRKTGYVQQQDLHLSTSTVREALNFSALLRQPAHISRENKLAYVDEVIKLLDMEEYADAVVGVPGEGLNVEQRKRLTIGVELAAKPQLLIFLDEPTSGLDSQTSWAICDLMEKLARESQQAVLFTIHQPSAMLFQRFDRLLFLATGGKTVYFGEIGENSQTMINYFVKNGASPCPPHANPAEWMLEVIGAAPGSYTDIDWFQTWRNSAEYQEVHRELDRLKAERPQETDAAASSPADEASYREFAAPFGVQFYEVTKRVFEQYWRTPSYIYSKGALCLCTALFIGFSFFKAQNTLQGLENQMFSMFMLMTIFPQLVQQIMPLFVTQRALYEVRERPSKVYSWKAFMLSNILVEIPWCILMAVILFFTWYYPIGLYANAEPTHAVHERGALMFLYILVFLLFSSTFSHMIVAGIETAETASNLANLMFSLCLIFCGVLAQPSEFPRFWIFMYRVSPFTYMVSGMLSTAVSGTSITCAANEILTMDPPSGQSCSQYLGAYAKFSGAAILNGDATAGCQLCPSSSTDQFLAQVGIYWKDAWRNFGLVWVYVGFNVGMALFLYWLARVPKRSRMAKEKKE